MYRQAITRQARLFSSTAYYRKSVTETAKETLKSADRAVSDKLVDGIEATENITKKATASAKQTVNKGTAEAKHQAGKAADKTKEVAEDAKQKAK